MNDSEHKTEVNDNGGVAAEQETPSAPDRRGGELIGTAVKAVAVTLSVVMLILAILTVAMPFSAMRVFNNLGMSERALTSGERYIASHIRGADDTDALGNYKTLGASDEYVTQEFIEALDTCITLSDKLMRANVASGDEASVAHFAKKLERYTRMYASLYGVSEINAAKDAANIAAVPFVSMRPYVFSYAQTIAELNYRARAHLGETNELIYRNAGGDCMTQLNERSNTFFGAQSADTVDARYSLLRSFAMYAAQLGEYVSVCFDRAGIERGLTAGDFAMGGKYDYSKGILLLKDGSEFSLLITPENGFTSVYTQLKNFGTYMQAAIDLPVTTPDRMLERLFIINELMTTAKILWETETILYYNRDLFGISLSQVVAEYNDHTCELYNWVTYSGGKRIVSEVYEIYKTEYVNFVRGE